MKASQKIRFRIDKAGNIRFEIHGIKGSGCDQLAKAFEELGELKLGEKTSEYYERDVRQNLSAKSSR
jgi:hypothetical protein